MHSSLRHAFLAAAASHPHYCPNAAPAASQPHYRPPVVPPPVTGRRSILTPVATVGVAPAIRLAPRRRSTVAAATAAIGPLLALKPPWRVVAPVAATIIGRRCSTAPVVAVLAARAGTIVGLAPPARRAVRTAPTVARPHRPPASLILIPGTRLRHRRAPRAVVRGWLAGCGGGGCRQRGEFTQVEPPLRLLPGRSWLRWPPLPRPAGLLYQGRLLRGAGCAVIVPVLVGRGSVGGAAAAPACGAAAAGCRLVGGILLQHVCVGMACWISGEASVFATAEQRASSKITLRRDGRFTGLGSASLTPAFVLFTAVTEEQGASQSAAGRLHARRSSGRRCIGQQQAASGRSHTIYTPWERQGAQSCPSQARRHPHSRLCLYRAVTCFWQDASCLWQRQKMTARLQACHRAPASTTARPQQPGRLLCWPICLLLLALIIGRHRIHTGSAAQAPLQPAHIPHMFALRSTVLPASSQQHCRPTQQRRATRLRVMAVAAPADRALRVLEAPLGPEELQQFTSRPRIDFSSIFSTVSSWHEAVGAAAAATRRSTRHFTAPPREPIHHPFPTHSLYTPSGFAYCGGCADAGR